MPHDQYHGQGGSYVNNPETGQRELVERTLSPEEAAEKSAKEAAEKADPGKSKKPSKEE